MFLPQGKCRMLRQQHPASSIMDIHNGVILEIRAGPTRQVSMMTANSTQFISGLGISTSLFSVC